MRQQNGPKEDQEGEGGADGRRVMIETSEARTRMRKKEGTAAAGALGGGGPTRTLERFA